MNQSNKSYLNINKRSIELVLLMDNHLKTCFLRLNYYKINKIQTNQTNKSYLIMNCKIIAFNIVKNYKLKNRS